MQCPKCGANVSGGEKNCPACNNSLLQVCLHCRFKNLVGQQFCGNCGVDLLASGKKSLSQKNLEPFSPALQTEEPPYYPLLSMELMKLDLLEDKLKNKDQIKRIVRDLMVRIESQLVSQNATVESIRDSVMFFSFRQKGELRSTLSTAFKVGIALSRKVINLQGIDIQIRVGMDLVHVQDRNPLAAVGERTVAKPGQIVVSHNIYQMTNRQLPYEPIGPIQLQGEMRTFYGLIIQGSLSPSSPNKAETETARSSPPNETLQPTEQVKAKTEASEKEPVSPPPPPFPPPVEEKRRESPPVLAAGEKKITDLKPVVPPPPIEEATKRIERKFEPEEPLKSFAYTAPQFTILQSTKKKSNIGYYQAVEAIEANIKDMQKDSPGKIIALSGDEGSGKSTIISMLQAQMPQESFIWLGSSFFESYSLCSLSPHDGERAGVKENMAPSPPLGERAGVRGNHNFPLYYWLELVHNLAGLPMEGAPIEKGIEHLDNNVLKVLFGDSLSKEKYDFIKTFLSFKPLEPISPSIRGNLGQMVPHLTSLLTSMAKTRPLVLIMENLEYSDSASIELLLQLIQNGLLQSPVIIILTYTPDLLFTGALQQLAFMVPFKEYVLGKIDEDTISSMAESPLASPWKKLPDSLRAQLIDKGSPIFLEESFRWLQMKGGFSIHPKTGQFSLEKKLKDLLPPEDLLQIIQERFESQEEFSRYILQIAAVLGERFSTAILADLTQISEHFEDILKFLWQSGFIVPDLGPMARFRHHLIWKVIYDSIDPATRQKLHQLTADYLEQARSHGISVCPAYAAHHNTIAGNIPRAVSGWSHTGVWLAQSGSVTGANLAFDTMEKLIVSGCMNEEPLQQKRLYESLAIINLDSDPEYAKNLILRSMQIKSDEEPEEQLKLQLFLTQAYEKMGAYPQAVSTIHRAIKTIFPLTPALSPSGGEGAMEHIAMGAQELCLLYLQGKYQEALLVYDEEVKPFISKSPWEDPTYRLSFARGELARSRIALMQCDPNAFNIIDDAVTQCNLFDEQLMAIHFRLTRSLGFLMKGNYEGCQREMELILNEIESLSTPPELMAWWGLIVIMYHCDMGDWHNASMLIPNTSYQAEHARDYQAWAICQAIAGKVSMGSGNNGEAQKLLEKAVTTSAEYNLSQVALMGWRTIAENELALGNIEIAESISTRAIDVARKPHIQNLYELYQLIIIHARILMHKNELKQAGELLEKYWPAIVKSGYTPILAEAAFQISELYGKLSQTLSEPYKAKYQQQQNSFLQKARSLWEEQGNRYRLAPFYSEISSHT